MMAGIIDYLDAYDRLTQECRTRPHPIFRRARAKIKSTIMRKWLGMKAKNRGERIAELEAEADLFRGCCTRAFDKWLELHPDAEVRPDGAVQIVEIIKEKDAEIERLKAEQTAINAALNRLEPKIERTGRQSDDIIALAEWSRQRAEKAEAVYLAGERRFGQRAIRLTEEIDRRLKAEGRAKHLEQALREAIKALHVFHGEPGWESYAKGSPEMKRWRALIPQCDDCLRKDDCDKQEPFPCPARAVEDDL